MGISKSAVTVLILVAINVIIGGAVNTVAMAALDSDSPLLDLKGAFDKAQNHWTEIKVRETSLSAALEKKEQALGGLYPKAAFEVSHLRQDGRDSARTNYTLGEGISKARFNLQQPLFRGFAEYASLRATDNLVQASRLELAQQKLNLYQSVSAAFFDVLMAEKDWENLKRFSALADGRISDLRKRVSIGKSRRAELLAAKSLAATIMAQVVVGAGKVRSMRELFVYWTGVDNTFRLSLDQKELDSFNSLPALSTYLEDIKKRPEIAALVERARVSEEEIIMAKGGHYPSVDLVGNVYLKRESSMKGSNWDLGLFMVLPVFEGGITDSKIRESVFAKNNVALNIKQAQEKNESEIRSLYETASHLLEQIKSLRLAEGLAHENYEQQKNEYHLGLTTQLEVLSAFNSYLDNKRQLDRAHLLVRAQYYAMESMVGRMP